MKTNTQNQKKTGLKNRSEQLSTPNTRTNARQDQRDGKGNLPPIDTEQRKKNRTLPTPTLLNELRSKLPDVYGLAEVVGGKPDSGWVWVQFAEAPAAEVRQQLAQLGFHWNRLRQAWQHPCGKFTMGRPSDPRERYQSYHPADTKVA